MAREAGRGRAGGPLGKTSSSSSGVVTEDLNRAWYERNTGHAITAVQTRVKHPVLSFMAATLDGMVTDTGAVYEAKFHVAVVVLGRGGGGEAHGPATAQYVGDERQDGGALDHHRGRQMGRDHNRGPTSSISTSCSPPRRSSGAVSSPGSRRGCSGVETPRPRIEGVRIVDMGSSNSWAEFAAVFPF